MSDSKHEILGANFSGLPPAAQTKIAEGHVKAAVSDLRGWKGIYELCLELRNFEISQLVQRNNFFMIFQGVLLAGVCQSAGQVPIVSFMACLAGLVVSILQAGMAAGAKYWQVHWEINTQKSEQVMMKVWTVHDRLHDTIEKNKVEIDPALFSQLESRRLLIHLFEEDYNRDLIEKSLKQGRIKRKVVNHLIMQRFSASRIPIYVGICLAIIWFALLVCTIRIPGLNLQVLSIITGFPGK